MKISTANHIITRQIQNSNIPFKYQVNLPWNTPVGLPKAFQRKTNWKYWIKYIKPIWCPQQNITPPNPIEIYQKAGLISWCVRVFNPMQRSRHKVSYTRIFFDSIKKKLGYCPDTSHEREARLIRKCVKNSEKILILKFSKTWDLHHMRL